MDDAVNKRIDEVLDKNKWHVRVMSGMAILIFILGVGTLIYGIYNNNVLVATPSALASIFLYWPFNQIRKVRKENIAIAIAPALIKNLPPEDAAKELVKLLDKISQ